LSDDYARKDTFGAGSMLVIPGKTVAVKTGTTDQKRDNWTIGYSPNIVAGVWVGNNDNSIMNPLVTSGVTGASPIWHRIMVEITKGAANDQFKVPDKVVAMEIDAVGGGLPHGSNPKRTEYFIKGTEPTAEAQIYRKVKVSKANGKLANEMEIKTGDYDEKDFIVITENDPVSTDGKNRWQDGINAWIADTQKDNSLYKVPTDTSDNRLNDVVVRVESPNDHDRIDSNNVQIRAKALSLKNITRFRVEVDGSEKINKSQDSLDETLVLSDGTHTIKFHADDSGGNSTETEVHIGVKTNWDTSSPTPTPTPTP